MNTMIANYKSSRPVYNWSFSVKLQIKASGEKGVWRVIMAPINPVYWEESRWKRHSVTEERAEDNEEQTTLAILVKELNRDRDHKTIPQKQSQHFKKVFRNQKKKRFCTYLFIFSMNYSPMKHCEWCNEPKTLVPGLHIIEGEKKKKKTSVYNIKNNFKKGWKCSFLEVQNHYCSAKWFGEESNCEFYD